MGDGAHRIDFVTPAASEEEAAAVIAALEHFLRETAPAPSNAAPVVNAWERAALLEGTGREPDAPSPWGDPGPW